MPPHILLTVDVEDWFQVENLRPCCPVSSWSSYELRVEKNTHRILDLLDEASLERSAISDQRSAVSGRLFSVDNKSSESCLSAVSQADKSCLKGFIDNGDGQLTTDNLPTKNSLKATFFVLGWLAERLPNLVREIHSRGHEIASHGYGHELCSQCSSDDLREDLAKSKRLLENIIGASVYGYRAPSFSIGDEILKLIEEAGYLYDSSYNSFGMHGRYGKISLNGHERSGIAFLLNQKSTIENHKFYELPISNLVLSFGLNNPSNSSNPSNLVLPWGGGAYFRLIPSWVFMKGVRGILRQQQAYLFYMHPWEVDLEQPRPEGTTAFSRFKHYTNLSRTEGKLRRLLQEFQECTFVTCHEYLQPNEPKQLDERNKPK